VYTSWAKIEVELKDDQRVVLRGGTRLAGIESAHGSGDR
jgi:hypothetical protein